MKITGNYPKALFYLGVVTILTITGCKKEEVSPINNSLQFVEHNGHVIFENTNSLNPQNAITILMWVRLEAPVNCDETDNWVGILNKDWPTETNSGYSIQVESDHALTWVIGTESGYTLYGTGDGLIMNKWTHLTFVYDASTSGANIYIDGYLNESGDYGDVGHGAIIPNPSPLQLNTPASSICTEEKGNFPGSIDDISIWNIALKDTEIRNIISNSITGTETGLISFWSFDEGINTSTIDKAGNNNGTLIGGVEWIPRCASN
jgi:hypothetical protein